MDWNQRLFPLTLRRSLVSSGNVSALGKVAFSVLNPGEFVMLGRRLFELCVLFHFVFCFSASAQDSRTQYPRLLANSYFGIHIGSIRYDFSESQLQTGFHADS